MIESNLKNILVISDSYSVSEGNIITNETETIDKFLKTFLNQEEENLFGVIEQKDYFWDSKGKLIKLIFIMILIILDRFFHQK